MPSLNSRIAGHRSLLVCPACRGSLGDDADLLRCDGCKREFAVRGGVPLLRITESTAEESEYLGGARGRLRRHPRLYRWVYSLLKPVLDSGPDAARRVTQGTRPGDLILDLGSGNDRRRDHFVNIDMLPYPEVDAVADGDALPLADGSVAALLSIAVMEHVARPDLLVGEAHRVLRPGGRIFLAAPFLQPFHAAPHDYRRWTRVGLEEEVRRDGRFDVVESGVYCGPASTFTWLLAELLALLLSFGSRTLRDRLSLPLQAICSPLKLFDLVLARLPGAENLASLVFVEAKKKD